MLTPSEPRACLDVPIEDDDVLEVEEAFSGTLVVTDLPPTASLNLTSTTVVIDDNEGRYN